MEDLHHVTRQHILLAVREGDGGVLVERLSAADATAVKYRVGGRIPSARPGSAWHCWRTPPRRCVRRAWSVRRSPPGSGDSSR